MPSGMYVQFFRIGASHCSKKFGPFVCINCDRSSISLALNDPLIPEFVAEFGIDGHYDVVEAFDAMFGKGEAAILNHDRYNQIYVTCEEIPEM